MTTIFDAAAAGDIGSMNTFMDHDDFDIDAKDALGNTALHCAAKNGEAAAGGLLVECSADVKLVMGNPKFSPEFLDLFQWGNTWFWEISSLRNAHNNFEPGRNHTFLVSSPPAR
jgi:ankyrin repeat protein